MLQGYLTRRFDKFFFIGLLKAPSSALQQRSLEAKNDLIEKQRLEIARLEIEKLKLENAR